MRSRNRMWVTAAGLALACAAGCESKSKDSAPTAAPAVDPAAAPGDPGAARPGEPAPPATTATTHPEGAVQPVATTGGYTFAVAGGDGWWVAANMPCYHAATSAGGGGGPGAFDMLLAQNPGFGAALSKMEVDIERDVVAAGAFACGDEPCMYAAASLRHPDRLGSAFEAFEPPGPGEPPKITAHAAHHHSVAFDVDGKRRHLHALIKPLAWDGVATPDDAWAKNMRKATHLVLLFGYNEPASAPDVDAALAGPAEAAKRIAEVEKLVPDPRGRCVLGHIAPDEDIQPGVKLTTAQFAIVAPPRASSDVAAQALESSRSITAEVVLTLDPAPTADQVAGWIAMGKAAVAEQAGPLLPMLEMQFGQREVEALRSIVESGFDHRIDGNKLRLSLSTTNVTAAELRAAESGM